jgi:hypothetical protein
LLNGKQNLTGLSSYDANRIVWYGLQKITAGRLPSRNSIVNGGKLWHQWSLRQLFFGAFRRILKCLERRWIA